MHEFEYQPESSETTVASVLASKEAKKPRSKEALQGRRIKCSAKCAILAQFAGPQARGLDQSVLWTPPRRGASLGSQPFLAGRNAS